MLADVVRRAGLAIEVARLRVEVRRQVVEVAGSRARGWCRRPSRNGAVSSATCTTGLNSGWCRSGSICGTSSTGWVRARSTTVSTPRSPSASGDRRAASSPAGSAPRRSTRDSPRRSPSCVPDLHRDRGDHHGGAVPGRHRGSCLLRGQRGAGQRRQALRRQPRRGHGGEAAGRTPGRGLRRRQGWGQATGRLGAGRASPTGSRPSVGAWPWRAEQGAGRGSRRCSRARRDRRGPGAAARGPGPAVRGRGAHRARDRRGRRPAEGGHRCRAADLAVVDVRMPPTHSDEGLQAAAWIRDTHPEAGVLVLSQHVEAAGSGPARLPTGLRLPAQGSGARRGGLPLGRRAGGRRWRLHSTRT